MAITTTKISDGVSQIKVDGKPVPFFIDRGRNPKIGHHYEWHLFFEQDDTYGPPMTIYRRKADAVQAFELIWVYAQAAALGDEVAKARARL